MSISKWYLSAKISLKKIEQRIYIYFLHLIQYFSLNTGALNFIGWMFYAYREGIKKRYVQKCMLAMFGLTFLILLELLDFPPLLWIFDAHSMWHAGTIPVCYLWYR